MGVRPLICINQNWMKVICTRSKFNHIKAEMLSRSKLLLDEETRFEFLKLFSTLQKSIDAIYQHGTIVSDKYRSWKYFWLFLLKVHVATSNLFSPYNFDRLIMRFNFCRFYATYTKGGEKSYLLWTLKIECVKQPIVMANGLTKQTDTVSLGRNRFKTKRNKTFCVWIIWNTQGLY